MQEPRTQAHRTAMGRGRSPVPSPTPAPQQGVKTSASVMCVGPRRGQTPGTGVRPSVASACAPQRSRPTWGSFPSSLGSDVQARPRATRERSPPQKDRTSVPVRLPTARVSLSRCLPRLAQLRAPRACHLESAMLPESSTRPEKPGGGRRGEARQGPGGRVSA